MRIITTFWSGGVDEAFDATTDEQWAEVSLRLLAKHCYRLREVRPIPDIDPETLPEPYRSQAISDRRDVEWDNERAVKYNEPRINAQKLVERHELGGEVTKDGWVPYAWTALQEVSRINEDSGWHYPYELVEVQP